MGLFPLYILRPLAVPLTRERLEILEVLFLYFLLLSFFIFPMFFIFLFIVANNFWLACLDDPRWNSGCECPSCSASTSEWANFEVVYARNSLYYYYFWNTPPFSWKLLIVGWNVLGCLGDSRSNVAEKKR